MKSAVAIAETPSGPCRRSLSPLSASMNFTRACTSGFVRFSLLILGESQGFGVPPLS